MLGTFAEVEGAAQGGAALAACIWRGSLGPERTRWTPRSPPPRPRHARQVANLKQTLPAAGAPKGGALLKVGRGRAMVMGSGA